MIGGSLQNQYFCFVFLFRRVVVYMLIARGLLNYKLGLFKVVNLVDFDFQYILYSVRRLIQFIASTFPSPNKLLIANRCMKILRHKGPQKTSEQFLMLNMSMKKGICGQYRRKYSSTSIYQG